jgi:RNA ligase (TIGR02306 family)
MYPWRGGFPLSDIKITVERVDAIEPHPNADRLEVVKILGTQTVVPKGQYQVGFLVVFFPPDILLPGDVSAKLGVQNYLKPALFDGLKIPCRVAAKRLRGVASYGFIALLSDVMPNACGVSIGKDVTECFHAIKYEPPVRYSNNGAAWGDGAAEPAEFHRYTDIQNFYRYPNTIKDGTEVRVTEKIHGTNCRVGLLRLNDEWTFVAGSHKTSRKKYDAKGNLSLYWRPLEEEGLLHMLTDLCDERNNVIIFGELYGPGIQDLDYGVPPGTVQFRVFDISINGHYLGWAAVKGLCYVFGVPTVPLIYEGPFARAGLENLTNGPSTLPGKNAFKGREGCVITPLMEQYDTHLGRVILKSVSADYLDRKGARDDA